MVQLRSNITVADNSGALIMTLIHIYGSGAQKTAGIGDIVQCVVKKANPTGIVKDDELVTVVIVRTKKEHRRADGSYIKFDENAGVVIDNKDDKNPRGTRVFGPVARELKERGFDKIVSLAPEVY